MSRLADTFDSVAHLLQPAIDRGYGRDTLADYREWVLDETMQLWVGEGYAGVTEILNGPRSKTVKVHLAGGKLKALIDADSGLEKFAKLVEADSIEVIGRRGWTKALKGRGYREAAVHLVKEIPHGR